MKKVVILKRAKDYYENNKNRVREWVKNKYTKLYQEEINIKVEFGRNRYLNMSKEKKPKIKRRSKKLYRLRSHKLVINEVVF